MSVLISNEVLHTIHMTAAEFMLEIAVFLYQKDKLTLGQAGQLAAMSQWQFQHVLASRQIPVHYDVTEFEDDLKTLRALERL